MEPVSHRIGLVNSTGEGRVLVCTIKHELVEMLVKGPSRSKTFGAARTAVWFQRIRSVYVV
jgi:hypothetical protein